MRSLHVIADLDHGGAQTQLRLLAGAAAARGESVAVVPLKRPGPVATLLSEMGIEVIWLGRRFRIDPFALARLLRLVRRWRPDVIQSWDGASAAFCRVSKRAIRTPWVHTMRGGAGRLSGADQEIATQAIAAERADTLLVPNAFDPSIMPVDDAGKRAARQRLREAGVDVPDGVPVLMAVARLDRPRAMNELVWATDLVRIVCPGLRVLIAGDGPAFMACQRFAAQAVEPGLVAWLGVGDDLATIYAATDVVWCGVGDAAAPTPAVEALAAGKPLLLADGRGREMLVPDAPVVGAAGLRPRWDDRAGWARSTKRLLEDPEFAARIGREGAERVRRDHAVETVSACYHEALRSAVKAQTTVAPGQ